MVVARFLFDLIRNYQTQRLSVKPLKLLQEYEFYTVKRLERTRILVRLGPMLGLMGTLIPLSPALVALANGDTQELADNLRIAFSVTVIGLLIGGLAFTSASSATASTRRTSPTSSTCSSCSRAAPSACAKAGAKTPKAAGSTSLRRQAPRSRRASRRRRPQRPALPRAPPSARAAATPATRWPSTLRSFLQPRRRRSRTPRPHP